MINQALCAYLKTCRSKTTITQEQVSKFFRCKSGQYISNIERGYCNPPDRILAYYVKYLGASRKRIINLKTIHHSDRLLQATIKLGKSR